MGEKLRDVVCMNGSWFDVLGALGYKGSKMGDILDDIYKYCVYGETYNGKDEKIKAILTLMYGQCDLVNLIWESETIEAARETLIDWHQKAVVEAIEEEIEELEEYAKEVLTNG